MHESATMQKFIFLTTDRVKRVFNAAQIGCCVLGFLTNLENECLEATYSDIYNSLTLHDAEAETQRWLRPCPDLMPGNCGRGESCSLDRAEE